MKQEVTMFSWKGSRRVVFVLIFSFLLLSCASTPGSVETPQKQAASVMPAGKGVTWHLLVIGDSSLWGLGKALASQITADVGCAVETYDAALGSLSAGAVRAALEKGNPENYTLNKLKDSLRQAEYVVMFVNPLDSMLPGKPIELDGCFMSKSPGACELERFSAYKADLDFIWKTIIELRAGQPTILRATDIYNPLLVHWQKSGVVEPCTRCWVNLSTAARQAAENLGIPFLSRFDAFNGTDHLEDPRKKGYILEDGEHPAALANEFTARLLAKMGYLPTIF
jgi:hypothetical protein